MTKHTELDPSMADDQVTETMPMTTHQATYYAIVPSRGGYGSGERVRAVSVHASSVTAARRAAAMTRRYRASMAAHGGSSGGYRVVETRERRASDTSWIGYELDRCPSI